VCPEDTKKIPLEAGSLLAAGIIAYPPANHGTKYACNRTCRTTRGLYVHRRRLHVKGEIFSATCATPSVLSGLMA